MTGFPNSRMRRLRKHEGLRRLVQETTLTSDCFIYPVFVCPGTAVEKPVPSMPGVSQWSVDRLGEEARKIQDEGVPALMLFGIPEEKDAEGSASWRENGIVQQGISVLKQAAPELVAAVDLCFCEYTEHGHCGSLNNGELDNDATLKILARQAVSLADAGADLIAPSGMIDGMVGAVRSSLDEAGHPELPILSYAAKYASSFYGPFRDAAESTPEGDRRSHQMDPSVSDQALREVALDLEEGADIVMVKPALPYLDVIHRVKERFGVPTAAYQVSGEYSMIKAAGENGWIDEQKVMMETLLSIRRAGANMILTYFARDAARLLKKGWKP